MQKILAIAQNDKRINMITFAAYSHHTMNYYKNLNGHFTRQKRNLYIGLLIIACAIGYLIIGLVNHDFQWFDMFYALVLLINGLFVLARSKGKILFNKAYIQLDDSTLTIKTMSTKKTILWKDIENLDFLNNTLTVHPWNNNFQMVNLEHLETDTRKEIIDHITTTACEKNIRINKQ